MKRLVLIADLHCGHRAGLTPPNWQYSETEKDPERNKFAMMQRHVWGWYVQKMKDLQPIDVLVLNGDAIDGPGDRTGGTEQLEIDRTRQILMAEECMNEVKAKNIILIYGTSYHSGQEEDWEAILARNVGADKIGSHEWLDVNGLVFDLKHHVSSSVVPYGRFTSISRDKLWNILWAERDGQPRSDILIRSHVHYFQFCGGVKDLSIITPALQGWGSKFGTRRCSGIVDIGLIHFDITDKENWSWNPHILNMDFAKPQALQM